MINGKYDSREFAKSHGAFDNLVVPPTLQEAHEIVLRARSGSGVHALRLYEIIRYGGIPETQEGVKIHNYLLMSYLFLFDTGRFPPRLSPGDPDNGGGDFDGPGLEEMDFGLTFAELDASMGTLTTNYPIILHILPVTSDSTYIHDDFMIRVLYHGDQVLYEEFFQNDPVDGTFAISTDYVGTMIYTVQVLDSEGVYQTVSDVELTTIYPIILDPGESYVSSSMGEYTAGQLGSLHCYLRMEGGIPLPADDYSIRVVSDIDGDLFNGMATFDRFAYGELGFTPVTLGQHSLTVYFGETLFGSVTITVV